MIGMDCISEVTVVNDGESKTRLKVFGHQIYLPSYILVWIVTIATLGALQLIFYWKPQWYIALTHKRCSLVQATCVVIRDQHDQCFVRPICKMIGTTNGQTDCEIGGKTKVVDKFAFFDDNGEICCKDGFKFFHLQKQFYVWDSERSMFQPPRSCDHNASCERILRFRSLTGLDARRLFAVFGTNDIVVRVKPIWVLLFQEVLTPFYVFQLFSICLWIYEEYQIYAAVLFLISTISISLALYQIRKNTQALRDTLHMRSSVTVYRDNEKIQVDSTELVPGDIFDLHRNDVIPCDAVLLSGTCIINESMLTGESVPETKTPLPAENVAYNTKVHGKHTLFCGTKVLQTRSVGDEMVKAIATRTGFNTLKGQLVRSIMYPTPIDSHFTRDVSLIIGIMSLVALVGFVYTVVLLISGGSSAVDIFTKSMDLVTTAVPPALPIALTVGIMLARDRLKRQQIYCISPSVINTCAGVNMVVFDKTGTLTEDGLSFQCALPVEQGTFKRELTTEAEIYDSALLEAMVTCHSLTTIDGERIGDPVDLILFQATGWELLDNTMDPGPFSSTSTVVREPNSNRPRIGIIRQFPFASSLQRMAVLAMPEDSDRLTIYVKGAPERVAQLCVSSSIPSDLDVVLQRYTRQGLRVLAYAARQFNMSQKEAVTVARDQIEHSLNFLGLVIMQNKLKPESAPVIRSLLNANIACIMCTGDNLLTAVSVAQDCGLVPDSQTLYVVHANEGQISLSAASANTTLPNDAKPVNYLSVDSANHSYTLTMTGETFAALSANYNADMFQKVVCHTAIFARMSPDQKTQLIHTLQKCEYTVAMCGDGANDCGALKAAHAGISLSEAEASVASPFTSKRTNIECVPTVIREGRCSMVTSLGLTKYMVMYSMLEFCAVALIYWLQTNLGQYQFLYVDLFLMLPLAMTFGYTDAAGALSAKSVPSRILSLPTLASLALQLACVVAFQVFVFLFVTTQPFFVPFTAPGDTTSSTAYACYQGTCVFIIESFQILSMGMVFSKSTPHRRTLINNRLFSALQVIGVICTVGLTINPPAALVSFLQLHSIPSTKFKCFLLLIALLNFLVCTLVEEQLVDGFLDHLWRSKFVGIPKYLRILAAPGK